MWGGNRIPALGGTSDSQSAGAGSSGCLATGRSRFRQLLEVQVLPPLDALLPATHVWREPICLLNLADTRRATAGPASPLGCRFALP